MEMVYKTLVGPVNPKKPADALCLQIWILKRMGLWPPETDSKLVKQLYEIWSLFYRGLFMYIYTTTQILFFMDVTSLSDAAEGFFLLLTQISLTYKVEMFHTNRYRIQAFTQTLNSPLFVPKNDEEDKVVKDAMVQSFIFGLSFLVLAHTCITSWVVLTFIEEEMRLPIAAWFPFNLENPMTFFLVYVFQIYGISMSACYNTSTDTLASAMIANLNGQVKRLGIQWTKIGHEPETDSQIKKHSNSDREMKHMEIVAEAEKDPQVETKKAKRRKLRGEVQDCIVFHENILSLVKDTQDVFKGPIFAQISFSCLIICMTCFIIVNEAQNLAKTVSFVVYLVTMLNQILLFCWSGNELIYSSYKLTEKAYFSNFQEFDTPTAKATLLFMQRTVRDVIMKAGGLFEIELSLPTFMGIIKSSYSYLALLQSMQDKAKLPSA